MTTNTNIQINPYSATVNFKASSQPTNSFSHFILRERSIYWKIAIPALIVQFTIFKFLYPYPDFISDSYNYIDTATYHLPVNLWPIGYAVFMDFLHSISHTATFLLSVQFAILELSLLFFFYTFIYFYQTARNTTNFLFILIFFNPIFVWLSNAALSDALFNGLSLLWYVQLIWMMHRPRTYQIFVLAIILAILFSIRYTAMYYPVVALAAFALSRLSIRWKVLGAILGFAILLPFYIYTKQKTKEVTGTPEFTVFGGWQIANNALYMYDHIEVDSNKLPPGTKGIDQLVRQYFKRVPPEYRVLEPFPGTFFIKIPDAPLKMYSYPYYRGEGPLVHLKAWGAVSPIYNRYGTWLISHYPFSFTRYYLWLNTKNYFVPHLEIFKIYNYGSDSVWTGAVNYFKWGSPRIKAFSYEKLPATIFYIYPAIFMLVNVYFIIAFIWIFLSGRWRRMPPFFIRCLWLLGAYLIVNFGFSILATPVVLRYQVMPFLLLLCYSLALLEFTDHRNATSFQPAPGPESKAT